MHLFKIGNITLNIHYEHTSRKHKFPIAQISIKAAQVGIKVKLLIKKKK